jgi:hypothetical protein
LAQSVDGSYNSTLANNDPIATWENLGSSGLDVTQGTAGSRPTYLINIVASQPVVSFDGGDTINASTTADWDFFSATGYSTHTVFLQDSDTNNIAAAWSTFAAVTSAHCSIDCSGASENANQRMTRTGSTLVASLSPNTFGKFHMFQAERNDTAGVDATLYLQGSTTAAATVSGLSGATVGKPLNIGNAGGATVTQLTGDIWVILIYQSVLSETQRQLNKDVDEWALNGTFPKTP